MPRWNVHFDTYVKDEDRAVVQLIAEAKALASVIRGIPIPPSARQRLDRLNIIRAVRGTTGIEGTELTHEEVGRVLDARGREPVLSPSRARDEQEVRNAEALMVFVADHLRRYPDAPLTEDLVRQLHSITTQGIDYPHNTPGEYRYFPVQAGSYIAPDTGEEVRRLMAELVRWLRDGPPAGWDPVVRAIVAHFYVVSIHPFVDGNGRTARAVESFLLYKAGINARGFYSLANFYYRQRYEYISSLDHVRFQSDPDLTPFVLFALKGLVEELRAVHAEVIQEVKLVSFRDMARQTLADAGRLGTRVGERQFMFLLALTEEASPVSLRALREGRHRLSGFYKGVSAKTLTRDIRFLEEKGLVIVERDSLRANLEAMDSFTADAASHELK